MVPDKTKCSQMSSPLLVSSDVGEASDACSPFLAISHVVYKPVGTHLLPDLYDAYSLQTACSRRVSGKDEK